MGFLDFPNKLLFKTIDTTEIVKLGKFRTSVDTRVRYMRLYFFLKGTSITTERFKIKVVNEYGDTNFIYQSNYSYLTDIPNVSTNWLGWLRFTFSDEFFDSDIDYFLELHSDSYTRNGDTEYIGVSLDSPRTINDTVNVPRNLPAGVEFYGIG